MPATFLFLKLTADSGQIKGDATEKHFEKQIALEGIDWDYSVKHKVVDNADGTNDQATIPTSKGVKLTKAFDRSTTKLCNLMDQRKPFSEAVISMLKGFGGGDRARTLVDVTLTNGYVESVELTASGSDKSVGVSETVELSFETMKIVYHPDAENGRGDGPPTTFLLKMPREDEE